MALALYDRVQETTTTAGTGSVTLLGAVDGFQSFAVVGDTNTCYYTIVDGTDGWEVGIGTYSTTGPTLARTTVLSNSNGNTSPITLTSSANTKSVFLTYPAEKSVNLDASGNVSPLGTVASGTWQGSAVGVAYGGTGQTSYTDGQILIGNSTGNTLAKATLTAGTGISVTNGSGSITIANSGVAAYPGVGLAVSTGSAWGTSKTSPTGDVVGTTDTQTLSGKTITGTKETVYTITDGAAFEIDPANGGIQTVTLGASRTPAATNFLAGQSVTLMIDDGSAYTITWTTVNPTWVNGTAPPLATSGYTVLEFWKVGTTIYGAYVGTVA